MCYPMDLVSEILNLELDFEHTSKFQKCRANPFFKLRLWEYERLREVVDPYMIKTHFFIMAYVICLDGIVIGEREGESSICWFTHSVTSGSGPG